MLVGKTCETAISWAMQAPHCNSGTRCATRRLGHCHQGMAVRSLSESLVWSFVELVMLLTGITPCDVDQKPTCCGNRHIEARWRAAHIKIHPGCHFGGSSTLVCWMCAATNTMGHFAWQPAVAGARWDRPNFPSTSTWTDIALKDKTIGHTSVHLSGWRTVVTLRQSVLWRWPTGELLSRKLCFLLRRRTTDNSVAQKLKSATTMRVVTFHAAQTTDIQTHTAPLANH